MFVYVGVQEVDDKNSLTNPSASPMKQLAFNRSPKQAISVRDINKPRPSRSTSIDGTPYFSGTYSRYCTKQVKDFVIFTIFVDSGWGEVAGGGGVRYNFGRFGGGQS